MATMKNDEGYDEGNDVYIQNNAPGQGNVQKIAQEKSEAMREEWVDTTDQNFEHFRGSLLLDTKKLFINLKNQSPAVACPQKEIVLYKARRTQLTLPFVSRKGATSVGVNINPILSGKFLLQDPGINGSVFTLLFQSFHVCSAVCLQHGVRDELHSG